MIDNIVKAFNSTRIKMSIKFSENEFGILDELDFLDDSLAKAKIDKIKVINKMILDDISFISKENIFRKEDEEKLRSLIEYNSRLNEEIVFLASNSILNIDYCLKMSKDPEFKIALRAIEFFKNNEKQKSLLQFNKFFQSHKYMIEHYLINKIYGTLLIDINEFKNAIIFLKKAVEKRPNDLELHKKLVLCYEKINNLRSRERELEIIQILSGGV